ncbi:hypothetical protein SKAU_G00139020 [Synaphobranchus kaupii]|uniref:Uncharacterized protein n=1 Tax=Synaphobranchus kaupii TaxID=118154 RepID=A0A9Q1FSH8_SYNKA|nr:hypothetical protein SKAU_G00139020 [Synaphobranchus kaupii]
MLSRIMPSDRHALSAFRQGGRMPSGRVCIPQRQPAVSPGEERLVGAETALKTGRKCARPRSVNRMVVGEPSQHHQTLDVEDQERASVIQNRSLDFLNQAGHSM